MKPETKPYTGGALNLLNGKYGVSAPENSVPVMKLLREHSPKTRQELAKCIEFHYKYNCECGIKSQGTVKDFGRVLYECQMLEWGEYRYKLQECIQWEFDLFVTQSLKGIHYEQKARQQLSKKLPNFIIEEANNFLDEEARVDLTVRNQSDKMIAGLQIKPDSFQNIRENVIAFNRKANEKLHHPVFYLYYNDEGTFSNLKEVTQKLATLC